MSDSPTLHSINLAAVSPMLIEGRRIISGINKLPVSTLLRPESITVGKLGLAGDEQADPTVHGGLAKAIYAYPLEHYPFWQQACQQHGSRHAGTALHHGMLGENLTISGLLEHEAYVGDVLEFADCRLQITEPRQPCFKFQAHMDMRLAVKLMAQSGHCGFYLAVLQTGTLRAGESFRILPGPRELSMAEAFRRRLRRLD